MRVGPLPLHADSIAATQSVAAPQQRASEQREV
jgi:hypothetical protein